MRQKPEHLDDWRLLWLLRRAQGRRPYYEGAFNHQKFLNQMEYLLRLGRRYTM